MFSAISHLSLFATASASISVMLIRYIYISHTIMISGRWSNFGYALCDAITHTRQDHSFADSVFQHCQPPTVTIFLIDECDVGEW